jgi:putative phosphonate metabolism protein
MRRYAIYYAPRQNEPIARFARAWLARDPEMDVACARVEIEGMPSARLREITADPAHYGFHGTLKAPFPLAAGRTEAELLSRVRIFAAERRPIQLDRMALREIGSFIALVPSEPSADLNDLAAACVTAFDIFRDPPSDNELARRRASSLTTHQDELLVQWGYPYVLDEFRFHLTLTGSLAADERASVYRVLANLTVPFCVKPLPVRDLVVFMQEDRQTSFRILARFPLGGG